MASFLRFLDHTQRRTTFGRTPLDERSAHRRDLYLTTNNTHKTQTSMLPTGFEPAFPAGVLPQTHALHRAATGMCTPFIRTTKCTVLISTNINGASHTCLILVCHFQRDGYASFKKEISLESCYL